MPSSFHALITGASSGIGLALAQRLAREGWALTLIARDAAKLEQARQGLPPDTSVLTLSVDICDAEAMAQAFRRAEEAHGALTLVVANAGQVIPGLFLELPPESFATLMEVNYQGTVTTARLALERLAPRGRGSLILVASGAALTGLAGYAAYSPSKYAVRGLAECLRNEFAPRGVHIGLVFPPDTDTPQLEAENQTKPAITRAITAGGGTLSAETVADAIWKGYRRKKYLITPGWPMTLLARATHWLPLLLWRGFDRKVRKALSR